MTVRRDGKGWGARWDVGAECTNFFQVTEAGILLLEKRAYADLKKGLKRAISDDYITSIVLATNRPTASRFSCLQRYNLSPRWA